jgi:hypothetical protein
VVSKPGSQGTDYRLHLEFDLGTLTITDLTLTDAHGGESLKQYPLQAGEIAVGDRGYAQRQGIAAAVAAGAEVIVRLNWQNVPLTGREGPAFDLFAAPRELAPAKDGTPAVAGRLIGVRVSAKAAQAARRKLKAPARKKGKTPDARRLEACDYRFLFTPLSAERWAAAAVLEVYRFRWQIELAFKRLKSLLAVEELAAKDDRFCRTSLSIKLIGALLVEQLSHRWVIVPPGGMDPRERCRCGGSTER